MPKVIITEPGENPQPHEFELKRDFISIGRSRSNDIVTGCSRTSGKHCVIERVKGGYIMRDTESTNGIKLKNTRMEVIDLHDGTEVRIGDVSLKFRLSKKEMKKLGEQKFTSRQKEKQPVVKGKDDARKKDGTAPSPGLRQVANTLIELLNRKLHRLWAVDTASIRHSARELLVKLKAGKKAEAQGRQGLSGWLLLVMALVIVYVLYKLNVAPENKPAVVQEEVVQQTEETQDVPPPPLDPDSIKLSEVIWLNADEDDNMTVRFGITNTNPHPVSEIPLRFRFYDVIGTDLEGGKTVIFPDAIGAGEQKEFNDFVLGDFPPATIRVTAEVIAPAEAGSEEAAEEAGHGEQSQNAAGTGPAPVDPAETDELKQGEAGPIDPFSADDKTGEKNESSPETNNPEIPQ